MSQQDCISDDRQVVKKYQFSNLEVSSNNNQEGLLTIDPCKMLGIKDLDEEENKNSNHELPHW